jgi:hypothetical protein
VKKKEEPKKQEPKKKEEPKKKKEDPKKKDNGAKSSKKASSPKSEVFFSLCVRGVSHDLLHCVICKLHTCVEVHHSLRHQIYFRFYKFRLTLFFKKKKEEGKKDDSIAKQGWLEKKGVIRHNWKKRWFVLEKRKCIKYYADSKVSN